MGVSVPRPVRGPLHTLLILAALFPGVSVGGALARVAPVAVLALWFGARHSRGLLRGVYAVLAGAYAIIVLHVIVWPWMASPPGWAMLLTFLAVGGIAFWTARLEPWWRGAALYGAVSVPLVAAFLVALSLANPFIVGWSRAGL